MEKLFQDLAKTYPKVAAILDSSLNNAQNMSEIVSKYNLGSMQVPYFVGKESKEYTTNPVVELDPNNTRLSLDLLMQYLSTVILPKTTSGLGTVSSFSVKPSSYNAAKTVESNIESFVSNIVSLPTNTLQFLDFDSYLASEIKLGNIKVFTIKEDPIGIIFYVNGGFIFNNQQVEDILSARLSKDEEYFKEHDINVVMSQLHHDLKVYKESYPVETLKVIAQTNPEEYRRLVQFEKLLLLSTGGN